MKPSICFVSLNNYAVLAGRTDVRHIGGAEVQQALIARELVRRGYRVSFVVLDHGQPDGEVIDGITLYKAYRPEAGYRGLRFVYPRWTGLWHAMRRSDADIYYQRMREAVTGIVALFCRAFRRRYVFSAAHDYDCMLNPPCSIGRVDRFLYRYGLRNANRVIAQTPVQRQLLCDNFGVASTVIPNCGSRPAVHSGDSFCQTPPDPSPVLWIGRFGRTKRLEMLLDVAAQCPDVGFDVVGETPVDSAYTRDLLNRAAPLSNVRLHGYVPHAQMAAFYGRALLLMCTSRAEGFPNTFVEAWSYGVPVVSTVDPGHMISEHRLGVVAASTEDLVAATRRLIDCPSWRGQLSMNATAYFSKNLTVEAVADSFEQLLVHVADRTTGRHHA